MKKFVLLLVVFILFFLWWSNDKEKIMSTHTLRISEIRDGYVIANDGSDQCILYNVKDVSLYDVIHVEGNYEAIATNQNRNTFQFATYLKRKRIYSSMYVTSFTKITTSRHLKTKLYNYVNSIKDDDVKDYLNKVFYRINEDQQDYDYFIYASGLHVTFFISLLAKLFKREYHKVGIVTIFFMMMLLPIAAYMLRIFIFSLVVYFFRQFHQREQLGISMIILYLIEPSIIYEISFVVPVAFKLISTFNIAHISRKLIQLLVLFPIQLFFFHECNLLALLFFPLLRIINGVTFLFSLASLLIQELYVFLKICTIIQKILLTLLPYSFKVIGKPFAVWMILWIMTTILYITYHQRKHLFILLVMMIVQCNMKLLTPFGEITYIDVGQGDCILIREAFDGEVMLIDVAGKTTQNIPKAIIYPVLKAKGIQHIDKVLITHDDYDHSGGLKELNDLIEIKDIIRNKKDINLRQLHFNAFQSENGEDENDRSIILFANINKLNYLFTGDASSKVEATFIEQYNQLQIDILKAGHHGSRTSSSQAFIHQIHPLITIISSGRNNRYHHPHEEVLDILNKENSLILNTQQQGSISIYFFPFINFLITGDNDIALLP